MSENGEEGTRGYRVEVGVTKTGIVTVQAASKEGARDKAKQQAEGANGALEIVESFTNTVREVRER